MRKKIRSLFSKTLGIILCLSLMPISAVAGETAPDGSINVSTFAELKAAVMDGASDITINADIALEETLVLTAPTTITGSQTDKAELYKLSGNDKFCLIQAGTNKLNLENLKLEHGNAAIGGYQEDSSMSGGAVSGQGGDFTAVNCIFENNQASANGGAIYNWAAITLTDCDISSTATGWYGAVYTAGAITAKGCTFTGNTAAYAGGVFYTISGNVYIEDSTFTENSVTAYGSNGGAVRAETGSAAISNSSFIGNTASNMGNGGALSIPQGIHTFTNVRFENNTAQWGPCAYVNGASISGTVTCIGNNDLGGAGEFANGGTGTISLIYAVTTESDLRAAVNAGLATINIAADITLTGTLNTTAAIKLVGMNADKRYTISGNGTFCLINYGDKRITTENLIFENGGTAGSYNENSGGILSGTRANVTAVNCVFKNSSANNGGAIYTWAATTATDCVFEGNSGDTGGAIYGAGLTTLTDCTFIGNSANWYGGAIYQNAASSIKATGCIFENNTVTATTGGVQGGVFKIGTGSGTFENCVFKKNGTVAANAAGGGVFYASGAGTFTADGCSFIENFGPTAAIAYSEGGAISARRCIMSDNKNYNAEGTDFVTSGIVSVFTEVKNDMELRAAIEAGEKAILVANDIKLTDVLTLTNELTITGADPENPSRLTGSGTAGIFEAGAYKITLENLVLEGGNKTSGTGGAINSNSYVIANNCLFTGNYSAGQGGAIRSNMRITLTDCTFKDNSCNAAGGAVWGNGYMDIIGCTFVNNSAPNQGGAVLSNAIATSVLTVTDSVFERNYTTGNTARGGAIKIMNAKTNISGCTFTGNYCKQAGGAAIAQDGTGALTVTDCSFTDNSSNFGTCILNNSDTGITTVKRCIYSGNTGDSLIYSKNAAGLTQGTEVSTDAELRAAISGGETDILLTDDITLSGTVFLTADTMLSGKTEGISLSGDKTFTLINADKYNVTLYNLTIENGHADRAGGVTDTDTYYCGGAVAQTGGNITAIDCNFKDNTAPNGFGGAINTYGTATLKNCTFTGGDALQGGVIYTSGKIIAEDCDFTDNTASWYGGCFYMYTNPAILTDCTFKGNTVTSASSGGGVILVTTGTVIATNCDFVENSADGGGGAIRKTICDGPENLVFESCKFIDNYCTNGAGGAVWSNWSDEATNPSARVNKCYVKGNNSQIGGGAFYFGFFTSAYVGETTFIGNYSREAAGACAHAEKGTLTIYNNTLEGNYSYLGYGVEYGIGDLGTLIDLTDTVSIKAASLNLSGMIGIDLYFALSEVLLEDDSLVARCTVPNAGNPYTVTVPASEFETTYINASYYYTFSMYVTSVEMGQDVSVQFFRGDDACSPVYKYSVADYAKTVIEGEYDTNLKSLCRSMVNYGAYSQLCFGFDTDNLANSFLAPEDTDVSAVTAGDFADYNYSVSGSVDGLIFAGNTMSLESGAAVEVIFKLTGNKAISDYTFTVNGETVTPQSYQGRKNYYVYRYDLTPAGVLGISQPVSVSDGSTSMTVDINALTYGYQALSLSDTSDSMIKIRNVMRAMKLYYDSAKEYIKAMSELKTVKLLAIGNSFTQDSMKHLGDVLMSMGYDHVVVGRLIYGGSTMDQRDAWDRNDSPVYTYEYFEDGTTYAISNERLSDALAMQDWDYVSLQMTTYSSFVDNGDAAYDVFDGYIQFYRDIIPDHAKLWVLRTWNRATDATDYCYDYWDRDPEKMFNDLVRIVNNTAGANPNVDAIVPSGTSVYNAMSSYLTKTMGGDIFRDERHLSLTTGRLMSAMTYASMITGKPVTTDIWRPEGVTDDVMKVAVESVNNAVLNPDVLTQSEYVNK